MHGDPILLSDENNSTMFVCCQICMDMIAITYIPGKCNIKRIRDIERLTSNAAIQDYHPKSTFILTVCRRHKDTTNIGQVQNINIGFVQFSLPFYAAELISPLVMIITVKGSRDNVLSVPMNDLGSIFEQSSSVRSVYYKHTSPEDNPMWKTNISCGLRKSVDHQFIL